MNVIADNIRYENTEGDTTKTGAEKVANTVKWLKDSGLIEIGGQIVGMAKKKPSGTSNPPPVIDLGGGKKQPKSRKGESNILLYVGIGAGVLILGLGIWAITKKK